LYNREKGSFTERLDFVRKEYVKTTLARMGRIFPAYGIGGVVNKHIRKYGNNLLHEAYQPPHGIILK